MSPGRKPVLYFYSPQDFWHEHAPVGDAFWTGEFDIKLMPTTEAVWQALSALSRNGSIGYIGPEQTRAQMSGLKVDVHGLLPRLNWERSFKSEYEVRCTERATRKAAKGHVAAREAFLAGGSELDIHIAFLRATRSLEEALPYPTIVCLNEKAAVLHYHKKRDKVRKGKTFLIDAGTRYKGYASDITRSYAADTASETFRSLLLGMNTLQQKLCGMIKPGLSFEFLHECAHLGIADLLLQHGILRDVSQEHALEEGLTGPFFPHGLGHMLGIFVHDVAGKQQDRAGTPAHVNQKFKYLRTNRVLDAGLLLTVEPGLYFIEMLLAPFQDTKFSKHFDWELIESLIPCGGIRIEDNILVTHSGARNLTREVLS